jgi:predicted porin
MRNRNFRARLAWPIAVFTVVAFCGEARAGDNPSTETAAMLPASQDMAPAEPAQPLQDDRRENRAPAFVRPASSAATPQPVVQPSAEPSAQTKTAETTASVSPASPLTWYGVTLYGVIDVGLAHLSHGAPPSNTYGPGLPYIVQNYSNGSMTSVAGNGLSQSKLGLSGIEPLGIWDVKVIFKLETGFQPTTGRLTDGPKSLLDNNGRANADKVTAGDSSRAGQPFQGAAFAGVASPLGTLTVGRQNSLMADDLLKYDPQLQSQAFSPIGFSGASGGLGDTEDKTLDSALKYVVGYGPVHLAALYQFGSRGFTPAGAESLDLGVDYAGLSVDILWGHVYGAISASSLSAAQNTAAPGTLAATVSDNTAYAAMLRYAIRTIKLYAGYEHMTFANPRDPLAAGATTIGGYVLSNINDTAFTIHKVLQYAWLGARYSITPSLDLSGAYYQFRQNSYNANGCTDTSASSCSGLYHVASLVADYKLTLRFDVYAGVNYSRAVGGMAAGFLNDHNWTSMFGARFTF